MDSTKSKERIEITEESSHKKTVKASLAKDESGVQIWIGRTSNQKESRFGVAKNVLKKKPYAGLLLGQSRSTPTHTKGGV